MLYEEITADSWKRTMRGLLYQILATVLIAIQTTLVKWGSFIGYTATVLLVLRGVIQFILCFIEATFSIYPTHPSSHRSLQCNISRLISDIKSIGIIPKRTMIPLFEDAQKLRLRNIDYGSFQSCQSYSELYPSTHLMNKNTQEPATPCGNIIVMDKTIPQSHASTTKLRKSKTKSVRCIIWTAILLRGIGGALGQLLQFKAAMLLPVGDTQAMSAMTAAITPFLAFIVFRDTLTKLHLLSILGALVGVTLIAQPSFIFGNKLTSDVDEVQHMALGYMYAVSAAVTQAFLIICVQFARKVPIYILTMSLSIWSCITGMIILFIQDNDLLWIDTWFDACFVVILGCVGYVVLGLMQTSIRYVTSGIIALLLNLSIFWGYMIQIVVFKDTPTWITIIGAICLCLAAVVVSSDKIRDAKRQSMSFIERNVATNVIN